MHGDPMMWIAGVRALYLQALHPRAVRGVLEFSDFRRDAWGRLMRTADYVGTVTYGTTDAAERAGARVRRIHERLKVTDPATGERYGVDEPELLLWVHCTEIDSYLHVLRRSGYPLDDAQADRYVAEHRDRTRLVGLDPRRVPATTDQLARYFERVRPLLAAGPDARTVEDFLRRPPVPAALVPARALLWPPVSDLAHAALPPYAHELYGRPAPDPARVTRMLTATGRLPPGHIVDAMTRLGPGSRPTPYKLSVPGAILDPTGRAEHGDGGGSARWRRRRRRPG
ncbi:oxygenase MpaB family protein [Streptomyces yaizuensis]|nr:oxygenase MpaB family protein [Streptomyces sp. YSPA8]